MVLRAVARARASRLARPVDRSSPRGFVAGHSERVRRGPAHQCAGEPAERSRRIARRQPALRAGLLRQFRLGRDRTIAGVSDLGAATQYTASRTLQFGALTIDAR